MRESFLEEGAEGEPLLHKVDQFLSHKQDGFGPFPLDYIGPLVMDSREEVGRVEDAVRPEVPRIEEMLLF